MHGVDANGEEILWSSSGQQVMMQWEKDYMQHCADALEIQSGKDRVLEIGFGLGYSAHHIQTYAPRSHVIIEYDAAVVERAQQFASQHHNVEIVHGSWQEKLPTLGCFDCIFFDDYPLPELEQQNSMKPSRWHQFLDIALQHVQDNSRITGYLARHINLQRAGCKIKVTPESVQVPDSCDYFPTTKAFIPLLTVQSSITAATSVSPTAIDEPPVDARTRYQAVQEYLHLQQASEEVDTHSERSSPRRYHDVSSRRKYLESLRSKARK